jgi:hypothetical protein
MKHGSNTDLARVLVTPYAKLIADGKSKTEPFILDSVTSELDKHAYSDSGRLEFVEELRFVGPLIFSGDFEFDDHLLCDEEVSLVITNDVAFVEDFDFALDLGREST